MLLCDSALRQIQGNEQMGSITQLKLTTKDKKSKLIAAAEPFVSSTPKV